MEPSHFSPTTGRGTRCLPHSQVAVQLKPLSTEERTRQAQAANRRPVGRSMPAASSGVPCALRSLAASSTVLVNCLAAGGVGVRDARCSSTHCPAGLPTALVDDPAAGGTRVPRVVLRPPTTQPALSAALLDGLCSRRCGCATRGATQPNVWLGRILPHLMALQQAAQGRCARCFRAPNPWPHRLLP